MDRETLVDRALIADVVVGLAHAQDDKDWPQLRRLLADEVRLDLAGHLGEPPVDMSADELVATCRSTIGGFEALHHAPTAPLITVEDGRAECRVTVTAYHHLPTEPGVEDHYTMRGSWVLRLTKVHDAWLVTSWKIVKSAEDGFAGIYQLAQNALDESPAQGPSRGAS